VQVGVSPLLLDPREKGRPILDMRRFTQKELAQYNGKDGRSAFIAYEGRVYDVSRSFLWQNGRHQVLHVAGVDLTASLAQAPHGADLLERVPMIGILEED
jgi:predicted heme/steroid binding protein